MQIDRVARVDAALVEAFARLIPQLSAVPPPTAGDLAAIVGAPGSVLLVARDGATIVGALALTLYRIPTGQMARIDDVVVDERARGHGVGEALTHEALAIARAAGARSVNLTSRPERAAANRLYERLGFERVTTNVYRFRL